jgi:capsid assembly protein Gp20
MYDRYNDVYRWIPLNGDIAGLAARTEAWWSPAGFNPRPDQEDANQGPVGGSYGTYLDGSARTEAELVTKYRQMVQQPEIRQAIDNIVNEAIVVQKETPICQVDLHAAEYVPDQIGQVTQEEIQNVLKLPEPSEPVRTGRTDETPPSLA